MNPLIIILRRAGLPVLSKQPKMRRQTSPAYARDATLIGAKGWAISRAG